MTKPNHTVAAGNVTFANDAQLSLIAGPCQLESRQHAFDMAGAERKRLAAAASEHDGAGMDPLYFDARDRPGVSP